MFDIIVVGSGPSGLSCAIEAKKAGLSALVLEKGSLVDSIRRFPSNLVWFSTPELLELGDVPFVVSTTRPTRVDALRYYQRVTRYFDLQVRYHDAVESISRKNGYFLVRTRHDKTYPAKNVIIATGYFDNPNRLSVPGESLPKVFHYYDEAFRYVGCDVAVVGGRNSAVEASLDLFRHGTRVTLIHRGEKLSDGVKYWILPDIQNRINSGEIRAIFRSSIREIRDTSVLLDIPAGTEELANDFVFVLIGFHPDVDHLRRFGVETDPETLAPLHDENTLETNVAGLYVAGSIVAGKNNNKVFVENGRTHGSKIISSILSRK
jgi:thioredoxin reductase (NADPH)